MCSPGPLAWETCGQHHPEGGRSSTQDHFLEREGPRSPGTQEEALSGVPPTLGAPLTLPLLAPWLLLQGAVVL